MFIAAWFSIALLVFLILLNVDAIADLRRFSLADVLFKLLGAVLGTVGVISTFILFGGMLWFNIARSASTTSKLLWTLLIVLTNIIGALLMYLFVYRDCRGRLDESEGVAKGTPPLSP